MTFELVHANYKLPFTDLYLMQLKATLIDGSPLRGKSIELIVKIPHERSHYRWHWSYSQQEVFRKKYTVPENGVIDFVVPGKNISQKARFLTLEVCL